MANKATIRNAYGVPAMFAGSKTGSDDAAFVFVKVGDEERRMRWAEWDALPAWTGPRPCWDTKTAPLFYPQPNMTVEAGTSMVTKCHHNGNQTSAEQRR